MTKVSRQRGFTLIELMIVLAIITVLTVGLATMSSPGGSGSPQTYADRITGMIQFARLRAESRRTTHQVQVNTTTISVWEATTSGFATPVAFQLVQTMDVPSGVVVWAADTVTRTATGSSPTQNASLPFTINVKPDGQSTGGTVFLTDVSTTSKFRVFVYKTTGTAISRELW